VRENFSVFAFSRHIGGADAFGSLEAVSLAETAGYYLGSSAFNRSRRVRGGSVRILALTDPPGLTSHSPRVALAKSEVLFISHRVGTGGKRSQ
jgi:hypothetical protein